MASTTDPYLGIYEQKLSHIDQSGLMDMLARQRMPMKPMEPEVLEPLKLEHFYIILIGNTVGLMLASVAFAFEKIIWAKKAANN